MSNTYKIRVHKGQMETRYGVDSAIVVDDPSAPKTKKKIIEELMYELGYEESENGNSEYPGYYDGEVGAYFDYIGCIEIDIPETIINRILENKE